MTRYARGAAAVSFVVLLMVGLTATTPLWLTAVCAAAAVALVPVFIPPHEDGAS